MPTTSRAVVVAVGRSGSTAAVEYAVDEAVRRRRGLHLVHVGDRAAADASGATTPDAQAADVLARALQHATARASGRVSLSSGLVPSPTVEGVVSSGLTAPVVVVGRRPRPRTRHPYVVSVTGGVAARACVPVVSVPDGWTDRTGSPHVVVGVDDARCCDDLLLEAFIAARARGARVTVISTWWRPTGAGGRPLTQVDDRTRPEVVRADLDEATARMWAAFPDVPVEYVVCSARPGELLIDASVDASLLVLGRHDSVLPAGSHLGPVARAVLREASCPVLLAAPRSSPHRSETATHVGAGRLGAPTSGGSAT
jgi:nucleotide-binding universal stress UspA family protein